MLGHCKSSHHTTQNFSSALLHKRRVLTFARCLVMKYMYHILYADPDGIMSGSNQSMHELLLYAIMHEPKLCSATASPPLAYCAPPPCQCPDQGTEWSRWLKECDACLREVRLSIRIKTEQ